MAASARALAAGDALGALKRVALRDDPPALALRGIAMAQLGEHARARDLLRRAARAFGAHEELARARCVVAEAEVALALREVSGLARSLTEASSTLERHGDRANAWHARLLAARQQLLMGRLDDGRTGPCIARIASRQAASPHGGSDRGTRSARQTRGPVPRRTQRPDETHRARLRVEIGRLRALVKTMVRIEATASGFALQPRDDSALAVLVPPIDGEQAALVALLLRRRERRAWRELRRQPRLGRNRCATACLRSRHRRGLARSGLRV